LKERINELQPIYKRLPLTVTVNTQTVVSLCSSVAE